MKIALVYPPPPKLPKEFKGIVSDSTKDTLPPLGLGYIKSNSKHDIDLIDMRMGDELHDVYDVVGFGGTILEFGRAIRIANRLSAKTIYGGPNATVNYRMAEPFFDLVVRGECDLAFDNIVNKMGIVQTERIKDLDKLKFPFRPNYKDYRYTEKWLSPPTYTVVSSRGCPFDCYFCSSAIIWDRKYTFRSVDNVIKEIDELSSIGARSIYFREDNFTVRKKRVVEFSKRMLLEWQCESRVDTLDEDTIKAMTDGGCKVIWFGIEHTDEQFLKQISKGITYKQAYNTINLCRKYGIKTIGSFMVGFPDENLWDILKNGFNMRRLGLDQYSVNRIFAWPRSEMYNHILREKLDDFTFQNIIIPKTKHLSRRSINYLAHVFRKMGVL